MKAVILAGGQGSRLWPLSRKDYPKQFLRVNSEHSLLQITYERLLSLFAAEDIYLITNTNYKFHVLGQLREVSCLTNEDLEERVLIEPEGKNTAPAIALAIKYFEENFPLDEESVLVCPSDHYFLSKDLWAQAVERALKASMEGKIVTFGIKPTEAETGYGYIQKGEGLDEGLFQVKRFVEKPDLEKAQAFLDSGDYLWNSGMFCFGSKLMKEEFRAYCPDLFEAMKQDYASFLRGFSQLSSESLDFAVMEKSQKVLLQSLDIPWKDLGSYDKLFAFLPKDGSNNAKLGDIEAIDTKNSLLWSQDRLVATLGVDDLIVIDTEDAVLVAKKSEAQKMKSLVESLLEKKRSEAKESLTVHRPWGKYKVLESAERYKLKRIVVNPGCQLSLQSHYHRSEHWVVIKGTALVTVAEQQKYVHENESIYVAKSVKHRLENPGKVGLEMIEVQVGEYVGEDDIVRYEDIYGRVKEELVLS